MLSTLQDLFSLVFEQFFVLFDLPRGFKSSEGVMFSLASYYVKKRASFLDLKGGVGKFEKPARDTLFVIFHGMLLTSR